MSKVAIAGAVVVGAIGLLAVGFWAGKRVTEEEASRYMYDVTSHLSLRCANEHLVALLDFREGRVEQGVRGLELLVAAKLANLDSAKIAGTAFAEKSFADLQAPLTAYQSKFKSPLLDPKTNPRLNNLLGATR